MTQVRRDIGRALLPYWTAGFVALACVAILALSGWREWSARAVDLHNAEVEMANLARSLTQHADDTFELSDVVLVGLVDRLQVYGTGPAALERVQAFLQLRKATGRAGAIFVFDEAGNRLVTTEKATEAGRNNADRDYFQYHSRSTERGSRIGRPIKSRVMGQWVIPVSRRFNHPDGSFAGVALTTIDVSYFSQFFRQFDIGPRGAIALVSSDGIILARNPDDGSFTGRDMSDSAFYKLRNRPASSVYYFRSSLDGVERLSYYQSSSRYPLLILATRAKDDVLAEWRDEALVRTAFVLGLIVLIAVVGFHLVRELQRRKRMGDAIRAKEADFRLLAEQSSDMVMRIALDERVVYVSPSCTRVLGWLPEQIVGTASLESINAEDLPRVRQTVAALKSGEIEEARMIYRNRHRDKGEIWVETALRVTRASDSGEVDGVVAILRDMTEHKDLQDKLAALATSDGLTGLANRRHFDERLRDEWARAKRDGTLVSVLMIDVDHFKKFNDHYGHQAGDRCLRVVAQVLAAEARRPADLAARYGGEEFVLLLPNTDAEGCALVGERVRDGLRALALPHAMNLPSMRVTVSLGGATERPASASAECSSLVEAADRALYAAKDRGRDCVVMSGQVVTLSAAIGI